MPRLFELQENCLRLMGHSLSSPETRSSEIGTSQQQQKQLTKGRAAQLAGERVLGLKHVSSLLLVISAQYPMVTYTVHNREDMELVTACLSVVFTNMLTVIKIITFLVYKQQFGQMMHGFRQLYAQSTLQPSNPYIARANQLASGLGRAYCMSCGFTGLYFMLGPLVKIIKARLQGSSYARELPMPMKFPFNDVQSPGYEVAFVYTVFVTIVVVCYASAVDGLFISFAINLRAHFQALQHAVRSLKFERAARARRRQLIAVVDYHVLLLDVAQQLRLMYMPIVLGQFVITSIQVGVIIYQIVMHMDSLMKLLVYFSFFGSIMLQLFIYCYGGEIIKVESLLVAVAVQLSDWHQASPQERRCLRYIMLRAQRETLIKAGFYEASLANFLAICRAAMSFIALIQSIE